MEILSDPTPDMLAMPRFDDGAIDMQELLRRLAEQVVNAVMDAEADQLCGGGANSRNGYRERSLATCVGTLTLRIPKLRTGSFFPDDVIERYQRVDRALVAAVAEMYATGTSTRKVQRVAEKMGASRLSKDQVSAIAASLDADIEELCARPLDGSPVPYVWLDATYVKCRRGGRVASTAVVTAIGCDADGWRRVLGVDVVDTESYDSWLAFLRKIRGRGVSGVELVVSDAHGGLVAAAAEVFQGAAWQRCAVPSCATACARLAPGSSGAAWAGSSRRCSAGATPPPSLRCTTWRATCWKGAARGRRRSSRRPSRTPWHTSTSRRRTGSACAPTTSRSGRTAR